MLGASKFGASRLYRSTNKTFHDYNCIQTSVAKKINSSLMSYTNEFRTIYLLSNTNNDLVTTNAQQYKL